MADPTPTPAGPGNPNGPTPVVAAIESGIQKAVVAQAMAALVAAQPWIGLPVVNAIVYFFVNKAVGFFMGQTILGINDIWIKLDNKVEVKAAQDATAQIKNLPTDATPEQIAAAQAAFAKAAAALITISNAPL